MLNRKRNSCFYFFIKELKGILKEAGNDKVAEVQLRIALSCIISNISLTQR